jgi:hypothetical protein
MELNRILEIEAPDSVLFPLWRGMYPRCIVSSNPVHATLYIHALEAVDPGDSPVCDVPVGAAAAPGIGDDQWDGSRQSAQ